MKRILLILIMLFPVAVRAQHESSDFFERYAAVEGVTTVRMERKMMRMMSRQAAEKGDAGLAELLDGIRYIRIVALREGDPARFVADAKALAAGPRFQLVASNAEEGQTTEFYLRETPFSDASEFLMITYGGKEHVVVDIYGEFDLKDVSRLSTIRPD